LARHIAFEAWFESAGIAAAVPSGWRYVSVLTLLLADNEPIAAQRCFTELGDIRAYPAWLELTQF
jgi:hypothetical protein